MILSAKLPLGLLMVFALVTSADAAAITYSGTVGGKAVGLEMTDASEDAIVGRFFWVSNGVDIPLQPVASASAAIIFALTQNTASRFKYPRRAARRCGGDAAADRGHW
ncbi:MAG: hypothetical protein JWR51_456 [Devosia sp.]|uniref:hypothetical protein n=1 Tax=Devosia sp. TaxID=1871048 RepID=UPI00260C1DFD|nr:hypothetical protein [Devosia sp.]MDB5527353.1 hypothetical protein [Devosia sp.]